MRKTKEELKQVKKKYGVNELYSWSKYNTYKTSKYEYFLKYIIRAKEDRADSIYTYAGSLSHEILESFYSKEIKYDDMIDKFDDGWYLLDLSDYKFNRTDESKNQSVSEKYKLNLNHFFKNHVPIKTKVDLERFLTIKVGNYVFQGYADLVRKDNDGNFIIQDWKTSSIYKGEKAIKEAGQLILYAEGLIQLKIPLEQIKICWNFLKYCSVEICQANGKTTNREIERCKIGESLQSNAKMWLKKLGHENELNDYLDLLITTNSVECLPKDVQAKYKFNDCYIFVPLTQDLINSLKVDIINILHEIKQKELEYQKTLNEKLFYDTPESVEKESFYFANLCGYSGKLHKPYGEYLDRLNKEKENKNNVFSGVGQENIVKDNLDWLNSI